MPFETLKIMVNVGKNICNDLTVPEKKSLEKNENFETRFYEKNRFVVYKYKTIDSKSPKKNKSGDNPAMKNVLRLMKYTQGENDKKKNMKLYIPIIVCIETIGEAQEDSEGDVECEVRMMVSLPPEYQGENAEVPVPNDPELFIDVVEGFKCYVRTFSGFANEKNFKTETEKLRISLNEVDIKYQKTKRICIAYDPPYKVFKRRNEVILISV